MSSTINDLPPPPGKSSFSGIDDLPPPSMGLVDKLDSYTGAPVRSAISAAQNANSPGDIVGDAARAYYSQFGKDPGLAPTGKDILIKAGMSSDSILNPAQQKAAASLIQTTPTGALVKMLAPGVVDNAVSASPAGIAGVGMDMASNPLSYVPIGKVVGGAGKLAGTLGGRALDALAEAGPDAGQIRKVVANVAGKVGNELTGAPKSFIQNYTAKTDTINGLMNQYGDNGAQQAADLRTGWQDKIQAVRKDLNSQISAALGTPVAEEQSIPSGPISKSLDGFYDKANKVTQATDRQSIQAMKDTLSKMTDEDGNISLKDLHAFKLYAQKQAAPMYDAMRNQIFPGGEYASVAAGGAAKVARQTLIDNGPSAIAQAEAKLSQLHGVEDTMNANLLKPDSAYHAINRAGSDPGGIEARALQKLTDLTGHDFVSDAKDFATSRFFQKAPVMPLESTGKSFTRMAIAGTTAAALGYANDSDWKETGLVGAALVSPAALKFGVNAANGLGKLGVAGAQAIRSAPRALASAASSPVLQGAIDIGAKAAMTSAPLGQDKWASQGLQNLQIRDPKMVSRLLGDPKGKDLLIQASDLAPGSKAMKIIQDKIQKGWGQ